MLERAYARGVSTRSGPPAGSTKVAPAERPGRLRRALHRLTADEVELEAEDLQDEVYDGSGAVTLVFLGRRRIRGIEPGRSLVARGRLTKRDGRPTLYNPSYELRPTGA